MIDSYLTRSNRRPTAVERVFSRSKRHLGLTAFCVRGIARVRTHVDLCMLTQLAYGLARLRS